MVEYLHFTAREMLESIDLTAKFTDFRKVDGLVLPFSQFVSHRKPGFDGMKFHENHYRKIDLR